MASEKDRKPPEIPDLSCAEYVEKSVDEISDAIAKGLSEPKVQLIKTILGSIGKENSLFFYKQTQEVEQQGGMKTSSGDRWRTSGGVFVQLLRQEAKKENGRVSQKQIDDIFDEQKSNDNEHKKLDENDEEEKALEKDIEEGKKKILNRSTKKP
ncbi:unnamed protein product [Lymnaea stagnalis]|uniref:Phosphorylated adapter RNA export protein n=1 Tax=Lymnaea stagnalis TaxID=6523 RepID=A0AAV2HJB7_LYMST